MLPDKEPKSNFMKTKIIQFEISLSPREYIKNRFDKKVKKDPKINLNNDFDFVGKNIFFGFEDKLSFIPEIYKNENLFQIDFVKKLKMKALKKLTNNL